MPDNFALSINFLPNDKILIHYGGSASPKALSPVAVNMAGLQMKPGTG